MNKEIQIKKHLQDIKWKLKDIDESLKAIDYILEDDPTSTTNDKVKIRITNLNEK